MRKARSDPEAYLRGLQHIAEKMAEYFGQPVTDFRYARFDLYDGRQWTIHCCWQRRVEELWVDEHWLPKLHG